MPDLAARNAQAQDELRLKTARGHPPTLKYLLLFRHSASEHCALSKGAFNALLTRSKKAG